MNLKRNLSFLLTAGLVTISAPVSAHTDINSDAGILANVFALVLVSISIVIFLLVSRKPKPEKRKKDVDT